MNVKLVAIGAGAGLLFVGAAGFGLEKMGYLVSILGSNRSTTELEAKSKLHSGVTPSSKDVKVLVRKLTDAQDRMVTGDREAASVQSGIVEDIAERFKKFEAEDWRDRRNYQSMMTYVLIGGKPEVIRSFLISNVATEQQKTIAKGVWSFSLSRPNIALKLIGDVDPRSIDRPFAAPFSLALASLKIPDNPDRGLALFDEARLLAPETAIEEAAMRREIPVLLKQGQVSRAMQLASRYVRCFGRSLYSAGFYEALVDALVATDFGAHLSLLTEFDASLDSIAPDDKSELLLEISRKALLAGKVTLAKEAATLAARLISETSPAGVRAKLFTAAADAPTERAQSALATLDSIPREQLQRDDLEIHEAARHIAGNVVGRDPQDENGALRSSSTRDGNSEHESVGKLADTPSITDRAAKALKQVDGILSGGK